MRQSFLGMVGINKKMFRGGPGSISAIRYEYEKSFIKQLSSRTTVFSIKGKCVLNMATNYKIYKIHKEILIKKEN